MLDFIVNVIAVAFALTLLAMLVSRIIRSSGPLASLNDATGFIILIAVAAVFVIIRDYTNLL